MVMGRVGKGMHMQRQRTRRDQRLATPKPGEGGFALIYMAILITFLLVATGLAVDGGRAYVVKAQLTKAVDGAALSAARNLNAGTPRAEAERIFRANFPTGYLGVSSVTNPMTDPNFFEMHTDNTTGVNVVTVRATAVLPTTFMRIANLYDVTVTSSGEAQRRMVDLSLVLDVSGSIGSKWPAVRDAAREFINAFDGNNDRMSLITYGNGARVVVPMQSSRGFNKPGMIAAVPDSLPGGWTPMAEGLYRGWDEVRSVPNGSQSGLRVIVLFTDGSANGVPGNWDGTGISKSVSTSDFPDRLPDPDNITTNTPAIQGLYDAETGALNPTLTMCGQNYAGTAVDRVGTACPPSGGLTAMSWLPSASLHSHHRSSGIPTSFPFQTNALNVDGVAQSTARGLLNFDTATGRYPAHARNIRSAATNLVEIIANAARNDADGDYPVRIYAIGMGVLVKHLLGSRPESSESVLIRLANDKRSPDFNSNQLEGKYYYAESEGDVGAAFQQLQNQIVRLSR
jgi:Flp pilus assembly protein TadG